MKNNELRIGNYVQHKGVIVKVEQITKHKIGYHKYKEKRTMQYLRYSEIEPIEITEDLLLKKGFEKIFDRVFPQERFVYDDDEVLLRQSYHDDSWYATIVCLGVFSVNKSIKYIHELQNAYFVINNKELKLKFLRL